MLFLAFSIIAVVLTMMAFIYKNVAFSIIAALAWAGMGVYQLAGYYTGPPILLKLITGYLGALMTLCMFISPIMFTRKAKVIPEQKDFYEREFKDDFKELLEVHEARAKLRKHRGK
jgi:hypothetical protein